MFTIRKNKILLTTDQIWWKMGIPVTMKELNHSQKHIVVSISEKL
jgi:hypothetical protein